MAHERPVYNTEYYTETIQQPVYKQTPVYATKYYYTVFKKKEARAETASANDHNPYWPTINPAEKEYESNRTENYYFTLSAGQPEQTYKFSTTFEAWKELKQNDTILLSVDSSISEVWLIDQSGTYIAQVIPVE